MYMKSGTMPSTSYVFTHLVLKTVILILQMKELGPRGVEAIYPQLTSHSYKVGEPRS